jgi:hypothetical protein
MKLGIALLIIAVVLLRLLQVAYKAHRASRDVMRPSKRRSSTPPIPRDKNDGIIEWEQPKKEDK